MMQVQKGLVKYKDRSDIICTYGTTDDGKIYYFLDGEKLSNGYIIASTVLVEAIDPLVVASSIGVIDADGKEVIPFVNKSIKSINDNILLVEVAHPTAQSVLDAIDLRKDPLAATKLVSTSATIKEKIYNLMGSDGKFVFNDQFSEAMICDLDGHNLMGDEKYSFIGVNDSTIYLSKNTVDSSIEEYILKQNEEKAKGNEDINIQDALISKKLIDDVMENREQDSIVNNKESVKDNNVPDESLVEKDESGKEDFVALKEKEETLPEVKPIVPNFIAKENDFELFSDDDGSGDEKSKVDDKKDEFSLFNAKEDDLNKTHTLELPPIDEVKFDYNNDMFEQNNTVERRVNKYNSLDEFNDDTSYISDDKDTIFDEAVVVINRMISQIEEQKKVIASYDEKLEKLTDYRQRMYDENRKLVRRYEMLLQEYKNVKAESDRKDDLIDSQGKEITRLKNQISSKKDLAKLLEKAQNIFDEGYDDGYSKVKSL